MSESTCAEPPRKKHKADKLKEYKLVENQNLERDISIDVIQKNSRVARNDTLMSANACSSCKVVIIVAKMGNGETWHGLNHSLIDEHIDEMFDELENEIKEITDSYITKSHTYLVTTPELRDVNEHDVEQSKYQETHVLYPSVEVLQIDKDDIGELAAGIDVRLSDGIIEVRYYDDIPELDEHT